MKNRLVLIGGLCLVFAFAVLAVNALLNSRNSAPEVCKRFVNAAAANNAQASYDLFTSAGQTNSPLGNWQATVSKLSKVYGAKPQFLASRNTPSVNPSTKLQEDTVLLTVKGSGGHRFNVTCNMQKVNKKFLVDGFSSHLVE